MKSIARVNGMDKKICAIDNGNSGSIGILNGIDKPVMFKTPSIVMQDYTKAKNNITRLDVIEFRSILIEYLSPKGGFSFFDVLCIMERPFKNPKFFK